MGGGVNGKVAVTISALVLGSGNCLGAAAAPAPAITYDFPPPRYAGAVPVARLLGAPPIYREFREWILICDNTKACVARYAFTEERFAIPGYFSLDRQAGPQGRLRLTLMARDQSKAPDPGRLLLDGRPVGAFPWKIIEKKGRNGEAVLEGEPARKFVQTIKEGQVLALAGKADEPVVPLDGMKAALLAMDEAQGRLDTETALVGVGPKPSSAVSAAPPLPVVYAKPAKDVLSNPRAFAAAVHRANERLLEQHQCDLDRASEDRAFALDANQALVFLGCEAGTYNTSNIALLAPRNAPKKAKLLLLPLQPGESPADVSVVSAGSYFWNHYNPDKTWNGWDAQSATFSQRENGRGLGDCGSHSGWTFDGEAFQLTRYDKLSRCSGGPEDDWPTLYRTRVVVK
jgi:hypothetical protein